MGIREDIFNYINENSNMVLCDDCLTKQLGLSQRQVAFQKCGELEARQMIFRGHNTCSLCGKNKKSSWHKSSIVKEDKENDLDINENNVIETEKVHFNKSGNHEIENNITDFMALVGNGIVEIYNEFSLQHELGIYLRERLGGKYKIQFERNVSYFQITGTLKKEMDIVLFNVDKTEKYCIELKYPTNGQVPEQMFLMCKDIRFLEQLRQNGFTQCYSVNVVQDSAFYSGIKNEGIYSKFRDEKRLHGTIEKPTGKKDESFKLSYEYDIEWKDVQDKQKYFLIIV
ncbi:hypothetical protein [Candidatus Clostridium radicumherbarum]|uniref:Uncharacterized protein n=1 Tax=Candidatus Clostridium radicumherbarum TaxID=3381662 RepID=A0ABW8TWL0_9CLOT